MMALYRIVEPSSGRIVIDGLDTSSIGLYDLRSRLALVPQVRPAGTCLVALLLLHRCQAGRAVGCVCPLACRPGMPSPSCAP